jgi:alanine-synthesizing transaminase
MQFSSRTDWSLTPNRLSEFVRDRRERGALILDLTESNPTRCGLAIDAEEILAPLRDRRALTYEPDPRGLLTAREAVVQYYAERGIPLSPDQIFLTTSTSEAYSFVFRLLANPGDRILAPQPSYPLFDLDALASRAESRCPAVLVVHPNNPTGSYVQKSELTRILEICCRSQAALIADEVFADYALTADPDRVVNHAQASGALTFTFSGLSKVVALPQMKLAWIVVNGPLELRGNALARLEVIADTYLSVSAPVALAAPRWLAQRHGIQAQILERVQANLRKLDGLLARGSPVSRLKVEGGWYAILRVPSTRSDEGWAVELLTQESVLVHPGHFYDFPSEGFLVLSLLPPPESFEEALRRVISRICTQS